MNSDINIIWQQLLENNTTLKLTTLRKDVLSIFIHYQKPLSAYDALALLKKNRKTAEAMTIYRVIEYLMKHHILHRISSENKYVFCTQIDDGHNHSHHHGLFFICQQCLTSKEITDKSFETFLNTLSTDHHFFLDQSFVEIKGLCGQCATEVN